MLSNMGNNSAEIALLDVCSAISALAAKCVQGVPRHSPRAQD